MDDLNPQNGADDKIHPTAYGVFKPVGRTIAAFPPAADMRAALMALLDSEDFGGEIYAYAAESMIRQADEDIAGAGILASIGQELNLVKARRELAEQGYGFLSIPTASDEDARRAAEICALFGSTRAQRYGHLIIEELIEPGSGERQVAKSPDRGLDSQTRSGVEGAPS